MAILPEILCARRIVLQNFPEKRQFAKGVLRKCKDEAMNWDDMRLFLAVARAESLTGAGKVLKLDPATLGRRIARLEETLGAALFARSPRGYGLTEAGERLMARAVQAEQALTEGAEELRGQGG